MIGHGFIWVKHDRILKRGHPPTQHNTKEECL